MVELFKEISLNDEIKSKNIRKDIFSYLNEKQKLKMIIYNKKLQNIFGVNINDFKKISGKYMKIEKNGIGSAYIWLYNSNNNKLIFEGEYSDRKRNGKGSEYYNGELRFEGEYLNGKKNGKGSEYYNDRLTFKGEYLNGEKNGKGKEYGLFNDLLFEGEYSNGNREGKGKEYYKNGKLKFEGEYLKGKIWNGKGYNLDDNIIFEIKDGKGYIKDCDDDGGLLFEGEYINGKRNGKGKEYYYGRKLKFEGEYLNGVIWNGKGYDLKGNIVYEIKNGKGSIKEYRYGLLFFQGEYLNGERNGKGSEYYNGKLRFEGEYLNGKRNGKGKEYNEYGKLDFEGEYLDGKKNGKGKEY